MKRILIVTGLLLLISCETGSDKNHSDQISNTETSPVEKSGVLGNYQLIEQEFFNDTLVITDTSIVRMEFPERVKTFRKNGLAEDPNNGKYIQILNYESGKQEWEIFGTLEENAIFINGKSETSELITGVIELAENPTSNFALQDRAMYKFSTDPTKSGLLIKNDDPRYSSPTSKGITVKRIGKLKKLEE